MKAIKVGDLIKWADPILEDDPLEGYLGLVVKVRPWAPGERPSLLRRAPHRAPCGPLARRVGALAYHIQWMPLGDESLPSTCLLENIVELNEGEND